MVKKAIVFIVIFCFLCGALAQGQTILADSIQNKVDQYNYYHPNQTLFVKTDKTLYASGERIWFTVFILSDKNADRLQTDFLSIALVRVDNKQIVISENHIVQNSFCSGSLFLPDSISSGEYELIAFTNLIDAKQKSLGCFRQSITIKLVKQVRLITSFELSDSLLNADSLTIKAHVSIKGAGYADNAVLKYTLGKGLSKTLVLDQYGKGIFTIPGNQLSIDNNILYTTTYYKKDTQQFNMRLPLLSKHDHLIISFYPEGGHLVAGLKSRVIWEAKTLSGESQEIKGVILEQGKVIDTIVTNGKGVGEFTLVPLKNTGYVFQILSGKDDYVNKTFDLPCILDDGVVVEINEGIVDDTLSVNLKSLRDEVVRLMISNKDGATVSNPVMIHENKTVKLPLYNIARGTNVLTVLNHKQVPVAERMFFAHAGDTCSMIIQPDKNEYHTKDGEVTINVRLSDPVGNPLAGIVTISCVKQNRVEDAKENNIESYYCLGQYVSNEQQPVIKSILQNKSLLEYFLLMNTWKWYVGEHILQDSILSGYKIKKGNISGQVFQNEKPLRKPVEIIVKNDSSWKITRTGSNGYFILNPADITVSEGHKVQMLLVGNNMDDYRIVIADSSKSNIQRQVAGFSYRSSMLPLLKQSNKDEILPESDYVKDLPDVVVIANKKNEYLDFGYQPVIIGPGPNQCGDFICKGGILNCPRRDEPLGSPAIGEKYRTISGDIVVYKGCTKEKQTFNIDGIYRDRTFYNENPFLGYANTRDYLSTVFWEPFGKIDKNGMLKITFRVPSLTGIYKINIQGVAENGSTICKDKIITIKDE
jgi:hypothetical protein